MPKLVGGGAERVLINLLEKLPEEKYSVDLFLGLKGGRLESQIPAYVNVFYLFPHRVFEMLASVTLRYFNLKIWYKLFGNKIRSNYDVGTCFLDSHYSYFLEGTKGKLRKKVVFIHSSYKTYSYSFKKYKSEAFKLKLKLYNSLDNIVAVSNDSLNEFTQVYGKFKDTRVIYNSINTNRINTLANKKDLLGFNPGEFNILAVGSHIEVKNYMTLLESCKLLKERGTSFLLHILGEGRLKEIHQEYIINNNLQSHVRLHGFVENPYPYIKKCDLFVMPSFAEGLPTALCEAQILGKPVLGTNVPGCREVLGYGDFGFMVENDVLEMANGIEKIINNKKTLELYKEKSLLGAERFQDEKILKKYQEVFQ